MGTPTLLLSLWGRTGSPWSLRSFLCQGTFKAKQTVPQSTESGVQSLRAMPRGEAGGLREAREPSLGVGSMFTPALGHGTHLMKHLMKRLLTQPPPVAVWPILSRDKLALPPGTVYWPGALPGPRPRWVVLSRHRRAAPFFSCAPSILTSC